MSRYPQGVVEKQGDCYVGRCHEHGTVGYGKTVEEAFMNLRTATWQLLERQPAGAARELGRDDRIAA